MSTWKARESVSTMGVESQYLLMCKVKEPLTQCLAELVTVQPADPIEWIAHWLYCYCDNEVYCYEKRIFLNSFQRMRLEIQAQKEVRPSIIAKIRKEISCMKVEAHKDEVSMQRAGDIIMKRIAMDLERQTRLNALSAARIGDNKIKDPAASKIGSKALIDFKQSSLMRQSRDNDDHVAEMRQSRDNDDHVADSETNRSESDKFRFSAFSDNSFLSKKLLGKELVRDSERAGASAYFDSVYEDDSDAPSISSFDFSRLKKTGKNDFMIDLPSDITKDFLITQPRDKKSLIKELENVKNARGSLETVEESLVDDSKERDGSDVDSLTLEDKGLTPFQPLTDADFGHLKDLMRGASVSLHRSVPKKILNTQLKKTEKLAKTLEATGRCSVWSLDDKAELVCDHIVLGRMTTRPPVVPLETPVWWEEMGYLEQTLYDPEVYSSDIGVEEESAPQAPPHLAYLNFYHERVIRRDVAETVDLSDVEAESSRGT